MPWERMRFRNGKIYIQTDDEGAVLVHNGLVTGKYREDDTRTYSYKADAIRRLDGSEPARTGIASQDGDPGPAGASAAAPSTPSGARVSALNNASPVTGLPPASADFIEVYTDGATSGNPGPSGLGVVLRWGPYHREIHQYIGEATNNIAELMAIKVGLEAIKAPGRMPVRVYTDSQYAIGVLTGQYRARSNIALISDIKSLMTRFSTLDIVKVKGHAGDPLNERVDELARQAITEARTG